MKNIITPLFFFAFAFMTLATAQDQSGKGLSEFENRDLQKMDAGSMAAFTNAFKSLTGEELKMDWRSPKPWLVKQFNSGDSAWLVLFVYPGYDIPDVSFIEAHLFDKGWHRLTKQRFPTGYRMFIKQISVTNEPVLGSDVLVIRTISAGPFVVTDKGNKPAFEQGDFQLQQYAASDNQLKLVRMTDDKGRLVINSYHARIPFKGPEVPKKTVDEWIQSLSSTNVVEVLGSLVWLTGFHMPSSETRSPDVNQESIDDAKLIEEVRDATKTKQVIKILSKSHNSWIKEYANLALSPAKHD